MQGETELKQEDINYGTKCIDLINGKAAKGERFFSLEFYPPKTEKGVTSLKDSLVKMKSWGPQWMDVTWGAGGTTSDLTPELCSYIQNTIKGNSMMHLTCTNMPSEKVDEALILAKNQGFKNILALRGDPPHGQEKWEAVEGGFECALDLIKYIRKTYGDYFGITVSGYPEGHPVVRKKITDESWNADTNTPTYYALNKCDDGSYQGVSEKDWFAELDYLKAKIDAGGEVIITQMFYDAATFIDWVKAVRARGIKAPILPGIMPIRGYGAFFRFTGFCKTIVPKALREGLEKLKDKPAELYAWAGDFVYRMCQTMLDAKLDDGSSACPGIHIYTMNTQKCTVELLEKCQIGFDKDVNLAELIKSELKRVLAEDMQKTLEKAAAKDVAKPSATDKGVFKEVASF